MFLDASAIVAILAREIDAQSLQGRLEACSTPLYFSPLSLYEATMGLARAKTAGPKVEAETIARALAAVTEFLTELGAEEIPISSTIAREALAAAQAYGRSVGHPADLNLGDCFAYACARAANVPLLYKGDDFPHTDLA